MIDVGRGVHVFTALVAVFLCRECNGVNHLRHVAARP
jgi:hypothetical protein